MIAENPLNYDCWFDYLKLLMNEDVDRAEVEDCFERAISNIPPYMEKRYWRRYIWLWIYYAVYEELQAKDAEKCREVYKQALEVSCLTNLSIVTILQVIPHKKFTFAKLWIMFAQFELRMLDVGGARKILGNALGRCRSKKKLYRSYIEMEAKLCEFDRCRKLYEKFLAHFETHSLVWREFARLECELGEIERARAILELGIQQEDLDVPEV